MVHHLRKLSGRRRRRKSQLGKDVRSICIARSLQPEVAAAHGVEVSVSSNDGCRGLDGPDAKATKA